MRRLIMLALISILSGCAYLPMEASRVQMTARDGGTVYFGTIKRTLPAVVILTVEVNRRMYSGYFELTFPNTTFGLYPVYGSRDAAPKTSQALGATNYTKAILSSSDNRILTCDFTDNGGGEASGLCVDDTMHVYDVVLS